LTYYTGDSSARLQDHFFATERINLPRGKVLLRTSFPSSAAGSLKTSPTKLVHEELKQQSLVLQPLSTN